MGRLLNNSKRKTSNSPDRRRFAKNTLMQYGLEIARYVFPFVTIPYLTRVLGADVYAVRAYILAAMTFMQVFLDYGFKSYGTRAIAQADCDLQTMRREIGTIMILRAGLCALGALALVLITPFVPIMAANPAYVAIAYVCVCFKAALPDFVFIALEEMGIITYRFVVAQTISTVLILLLVKDPGDLLWVPTLEALAAFIAFTWSWENILVKRRIIPALPSASSLQRAFSIASVFFLSSASTTIFTTLTTLMIGILVTDNAEISYWSLAMTAVAAIQSLYTPITNSLYPHMIVRRDFALFKRLLYVGVPIVLVGTVAFALLADVVMLVLGGEEYLAGSYVVALVSPVLLFSFPAMLMGFPVLAACNKERQLTATSVISALFHIVGLLVLMFAGVFSVASVAVLRCLTEAVLMVGRGWCVLALRRDMRRNLNNAKFR